MKRIRIVKSKNVPKPNIILAVKDTLKEIKGLRDSLHPYLKLTISRSDTKRYCLHLHYKTTIKFSK